MPAVLELDCSVMPSVKRKRDASTSPWETQDDIVRKLCSQQNNGFPGHLQAPIDLHNRRFKHLPRTKSHDNKRQRIQPYTNDTNAFTDVPQEYSCSAPTSPQNEFTPVFPAPRPSIAARASTCDLDLRPCHICHRQPRKRKDLEGFICCEGCGRRSCFVCVRECEGGTLDLENKQGHDGENTDPEIEAQEQDAMVLSCESIEESPQRGRAGHLDDWGGQMGSLVQHRRIVCSKCCVERGADGEVVCLGCLRAEGNC